MVVIAVLIGGTLWYVFQSKSETEKTQDSTRQAQARPTPKATESDAYKGWKSYSWTSQKVSFKYPGDWFVKEDANLSRVYIKNKNVDLNKEETPADFQQLWLTYDSVEASKAREDAIKAGNSVYRVVSGDVKASTIKAGSLTINVYEYDTTGGPTLEAYFTNKAGKRVLATTSTEVGEKNQKDMVANLKLLLASITLQ